MKKPLMPWIAITAFGGGFLYLGPTSSFISILLTGSNLSPTLYGLLSYTTPSIATFTGMYAGFSIFNPNRKKLVAIIYAIAGVVYLLSLYLFPTLMIYAKPPAPGELLDITLENVVLVLTGFFIISLLVILSIGFFKLSRRIKDPEEKKHSLMLGIGWILFAIAATTDAIVPVGLIHLIVIARVLMAISLFLIFTGFAPPKSLRT